MVHNGVDEILLDNARKDMVFWGLSPCARINQQRPQNQPAVPSGLPVKD